MLFKNKYLLDDDSKRYFVQLDVFLLFHFYENLFLTSKIVDVFYKNKLIKDMRLLKMPKTFTFQTRHK